MSEITRGANALLTANGVIEVSIGWANSASPLDIACFMVQADGRVPDDDHMVFYNQPNGPNRAVVLQKAGPMGTSFQIDLERLPPMITKCVFTATLDGAGSFAVVTGLGLAATPMNGSSTRYQVDDVGNVRALILAEVYKHTSGWKLRAVGQGFDGGLAPLARHFGVDVAEEIASTPISVQGVSPTKVELRKQAVKVVLAKQRIAGVRARVGLVIDASGSMRRLYRHGVVQRAVERCAAVAACLDDDGQMDVWFFGNEPWRAPAVTEKGLDGYVARTFPAPSPSIGMTNNEPAVLNDVIRKYTQEEADAKEPAFVLFFSDGGVAKSRDIERILVSAASHPIFWQFIGIGKSNYGVLTRLDTLSGRVVDNAGFFALDDLDAISDEELYARLLSEFPDWVRAAQTKGIIQA